MLSVFFTRPALTQISSAVSKSTASLTVRFRRGPREAGESGCSSDLRLPPGPWPWAVAERLQTSVCLSFFTPMCISAVQHGDHFHLWLVAHKELKLSKSLLVA